MGMLSDIFSKIIPSTSIVGSIADKIVKKAHANETPAAAKVESPAETTTTDAVVDTAEPFKNVDVVAILDEMAKKNAQKLNWKTSIVDLLKLLGLDSSLTARKALAAELHYTGSTEDSAAMNIWLHKAVMKQIAEKGGNVKDLF